MPLDQSGMSTAKEDNLQNSISVVDKLACLPPESVFHVFNQSICEYQLTDQDTDLKSCLLENVTANSVMKHKAGKYIYLYVRELSPITAQCPATADDVVEIVGHNYEGITNLFSSCRLC